MTLLQMRFFFAIAYVNIKINQFQQCRGSIGLMKLDEFSFYTFLINSTKQDYFETVDTQSLYFENQALDVYKINQCM